MCIFHDSKLLELNTFPPINALPNGREKREREEELFCCLCCTSQNADVMGHVNRYVFFLSFFEFCCTVLQ